MTAGWRDAARLRRALAVYVLVDGAPDVAAAAIAGGASAIQLRRKDAGGRELLERARILAGLCARSGVLFVVNDRVDIALACGAGGVHLGQDDLPAAAARALAGDRLVIGVSAATAEEARAAARDGADYVGTGPVFGTLSKPDAGAPIGTAALAAVARGVPLPVVAIGGITAANTPAAISAGAVGVAAISAVAAATDVTGAAGRLAAAVHGALGGARP